MLKPISDLPPGITGVSAHGTVTKHDYRATLRPILENAEASDTPVKLLYAFGRDFEGFTPEAAWEDVRLAFEHLRNVERCAIVSDETWMKAASQLVGALTSARARSFGPEAWDEAVDWLRSGHSPDPSSPSPDPSSPSPDPSSP